MKLFEDLGKIGEEEDLLLYQDDFKKFETNKGFTTSVSSTNSSGQSRAGILKKGIRRFETLLVGGNGKKSKQKKKP